MSNWTTNNIVAITLWGYLGFRKEIHGTFQEARILRIRDFAFWNPSASDAINRIAAEALAKDLHHHFGMLLESSYEDPEMTYAGAIRLLTDALSSADNTLESVSDAVDALFHVEGES